MFGFYTIDELVRDEPRPESEIDRLRRELAEAKEEIRDLRNALGGNHKLTMRGGLFR